MIGHINQSSTTRIVHMNSCCHSLAVPPYFHQVSPSTYSSFSRSRWKGKRSSPAQCSLGGRSGRGGGRSKDSIGVLLRHSAPSYTPEQHKGESRMKHLQQQRSIIYILKKLFTFLISKSQICANWEQENNACSEISCSAIWLWVSRKESVYKQGILMSILMFGLLQKINMKKDAAT